MAVMLGRDARVTLGTSAIGMGNWSISQPGPALVDKTKFGDEWVGVVAGVRDGGTVAFAGHFDWSNAPQQDLMANFSSGVNLTTGSSFRAYMSTDAGSSGAGYFKFSTSCEGIIQSMNVGQDKAGLGSIDFSIKLSGGYMVYTT